METCTQRLDGGSAHTRVKGARKVRRITCAGGCGRSWEFELRLRGGRPRVRCEACARVRELEMKHARVKRARRCEACDDLLPPYPGHGPMKTCAACAREAA